MEMFIGKVKLDTSFYKGEDKYTDGNKIENELLDIVKNNSEDDFDEILKNKNSWPLFYHLSFMRKNILSGINISKKDDVLEIGSGCGAITGYLCDVANKVTCIELSLKRSKINAYRNNKTNLEIFVGNLEDVIFDKKFDIITLIGVLEYAEGFITELEDKYVFFLKSIQKFLKPNGKVIIAIENRFGLKYWSGYREDHYGEFFVGLENYYNVKEKKAKTFTKNELIEIFNKAGYNKYKFYYPYPDYKFTTDIYSDEYLPKKGELNQNEYAFDNSKIHLFDQSKVFDSIIQSDLFPEFSNSFLCILGYEDINEDAIYTKISNQRDVKFRLKTEITNKDGSLFVIKKSLNKGDNSHIDNIYKNYMNAKSIKSDINLLEVFKCDEYIYSYFLDGILLYDKLFDIYEKKDINHLKFEIENFIKKFFSYPEIQFRQTDEFKKIFGEFEFGENIKSFVISNIDMIPSNFIFRDEDVFLIDLEWMFNFPIPKKYILFRFILNLNFLNNKNHELNIILDYFFSPELISIFFKMEENFQKYVRGNSYSLEDINIRINNKKIDVLKYFHEKYLVNYYQFYFDKGNGFSEIDSEKINVSGSKYSIINEFNTIDKNIKILRIDPSSINHSIFFIKKINLPGESEKLQYVVFNAYEIIENLYISYNDDPQIVIFDIENKKIEFEINVYIGTLDLIEIMSFIYESNNRLIKENNELIFNKNLEIDSGNEKIQILEESLKSYKENYTIMNEKIKSQNEVLVNKENIISNYSEVIKNNESYIRNLELSYNSVINSRTWKLTKPLRKIADYIKSLKKANYNEINEPYEYVLYNIDSFDLDGNLLSIEGWVFGKKNIIESVSIKIKNSKYDIDLPMMYGLKREDVYKAYNNEDSLYSGMRLKCKLLVNGNFKLYISVLFKNNDKKNIYINNVHFKRNKNDQLKEINKKNIEKALYYIVRGKFPTLYLKIRKKLKNKNTFFENQLNEINEMIDMDRILEKLHHNKSYNNLNLNEKIYIIIPIYNGFEFFDSLFRTLYITKIEFNLIIVEDCSTDDRVIKYLKTNLEGLKNTEIIYHEKNYGFVKSVNDGLKRSSGHVVLLNSDIELPPYWLERLIYPIAIDDSVASVTPYTNSGTICSFPNFCKDNDIYLGKNVSIIDKEFNKIKPEYKNIPTGVGFCMAMNKNALNLIGIFDEESFSKGYGEENDWCLRAKLKGFRNVIVENLFVYHKHGGSFLTTEKKQLIEKNSEILLNRYPNYFSDVAEFCNNDPLKGERYLIEVLCICNVLNHINILVFDHMLGGGASDYIERRIKNDIQNEYNYFLCRYNTIKGDYNINFISKYKNIKFSLKSIDKIKNLLDYFNISQIIINELVTYSDVFKILGMLKQLKLKYKSKLKLEMLIHDFYCICPTINLLNKNNIYCELPNDLNTCEICLKDNLWNNYRNTDMKVWTTEWRLFLEVCDNIIAFSNDSKNIVLEKYPFLNNITISPHVVDYIPYIPKKVKTTKTVNIGLMGILNNHKGVDIVEKILNLIRIENLNYKIILIGSSDNYLKEDLFYKETGRYNKYDIPGLTIENDIDIFAVTSICPETFSYTTEEIIKMGYPIISFNIGAPAERIKEYDNGFIVNTLSPEELLNTIRINENKFICPYKEEKNILFITDYYSFSSRYRVEHLKEEFILEGITGDFYSIDELNKKNSTEINLYKYDILYLYRCPLRDDLNNIINIFKEYNKLVYYDIDDFIFEYDLIRELDFLKTDDYKKFNELSNLIKKCMNRSDILVSSTFPLLNQMKKFFPSKPTILKRNMSSIKMYLLSNEAIRLKKSDKHIKIGYFSGTNTHNRDFESIEDILLELMMKYENIRLMIGGNITLNKKFDEFLERIERIDFVDWTKLPEIISKVDINLLPLETTIFHECKSANKWMEAALVKVPTICSYNEELSKVITNYEDGILCTSVDEWKSGLEFLFDYGNRENISDNAYKKVLNYYLTISKDKFNKELNKNIKNNIC